MSGKKMRNKEDTDANHCTVGIIGCGWLGKALATNLIEQGVPVLATSGQQCNVEQLQEKGITAQQLLLPANSKQLNQHDVFSQQCLVIAITPQFKKGKADYGVKVAQLVDAATQRGVVQRIILLSSTAVYQGLEGSVDENASLNIVAENSLEKTKVLQSAEQAVLNFHRKSNVLRLAGLVGPARHPGKFLQAKRTLKNSTAPVNLIHQQDAVGLILSLLSLSPTAPQGIFNGVSDTHVTKSQYYQTAAKSLGLELPTFDGDDTLNSTRVVNGDKAKKELDYVFVYPDLLAWL